MAKSTLEVSANLKLPVDWMTLATVVYGARGSGKTCLGRVCAEEVHRVGQRFCAIDLKGDWWGLKSSADGKSDGIPVVIFGGDHQDLPLEPEAGAFVAETIAGLDQSCILDLEYFSKGKQTRFLTEFFAKLYDANRKPLLLLLDEAQRYAPQRTLDPDSAKCLGAVEDLVKLGRKHGIGPVLFTQRGSGLNKEVSELCDLLAAFRTPGPLDQDRVKDWLDANTTKTQRDEVMGKLAGLPTGTAVFASGHPDLKTFGVHAVRLPQTFDSSATPKVGQRKVEPKKLAKPDIEALRAKMAAAIERAKADDPKALRTRIAELERAAAKKSQPVVQERVVVKEKMTLDLRLLNGLKDSTLKQLTVFPRRIEKAQRIASEALKEIDAIAEEFKQTRERVFAEFDAARDRATERYAGEAAQSKPAEARQSSGTTRPSSFPSTSPGDPAVGTGGLHRMMIAIAQRPCLNRRQLGLRSNVSCKGGSFDTYLSKGRKNGWIEGKHELSLTAAGIEALGPWDPLPEGRELLEHYLRKFGDSGVARMLRALADAYPNPLSRQELGELSEVSVTGGSFDTYLSRLRTLDLVSGKRELTANEELFS